MKNRLRSIHPAARPQPSASDAFAVRSVMPGSMIVPGLRYTIPLHTGGAVRRTVESFDPDLNRPGTRHVLSEQRV